MKRQGISHGSGLLIALVIPFVLLLLPCAKSQGGGRSIRIGIVKSIFRDTPDHLQRMMLIPFGGMMQSQTGIPGTMHLVADHEKLSEQLEKNQVQLGVFQGFEFAWAQEKNPNLKPLMIAVNKRKWLTANLVTRNDSDIENFSQLRGKSITMPIRSRGHCWLFLDRQCEDCGCTGEKFFGKIQRHPNIEDALDDLVRGRVAAIVVDRVSLDSYKQLKPGCYRRLKVVTKSPTFPAAVVAFQQGNLDQLTLNKFRSGMLNANKNSRTRQLMTLCRLSGFEAIPAEYQRILTDIRQSYPSPSASVAASNVTPDEKRKRTRRP